MNLLSVHRHSPGPVPYRALGLALAVVLLVTLLAPLAWPPLGEVAANEPVATASATPPAQGEGTGEAPTEGGQGDGGDEAAVEETPDAEQTPDAGFTNAQDPFYSSGISIVMRQCASDYGGDFGQLVANCWNAEHIAFGVYGGGVL